MKALVPTSFVIMGITGDLARNKLLPALIDLYIKNALPKKFRLVGFSRRDLSREDFELLIKDSLIKKEKYSSTQIGSFIEQSEYVQGNFDDIESFHKLKTRLNGIDDEYGQCGNKLLYLSVPPTLYEQLFNNIATSKLSEACGGLEGWVRILVEKPFGNNMEKAEELDKQLGKLFKEEQIFRIDHYLAKEVVQNVLTFRFCNTMFEHLWSKKHIESVHIHFFEKNDAKKRGAFYDGLGALRDVGQNHLLQMLALIAMDKPKHLSCVDIRKQREKVLSLLKVSKNDDDYVKAQYNGYLESDGVADDSDTETFFSIKTFINTRRWKGVPFHLVSGKALKESRVEIKIKFHDPDPESILPHQYSTQDQNTLTFRIQPHEGIGLLFWFKVPGFESRIEPQTLKFNYADDTIHTMIPDAYERVLYDCIQGDQTLFTTTAEVLSAWKYIAGVRKQWGSVDMHHYDIGENPFKIGPR
jgi:glucose-6-phosphate 1-dehydrogenase